MHSSIDNDDLFADLRLRKKTLTIYLRHNEVKRALILVLGRLSSYTGMRLSLFLLSQRQDSGTRIYVDYWVHI